MQLHLCVAIMHDFTDLSLRHKFYSWKNYKIKDDIIIGFNFVSFLIFRFHTFRFLSHFRFTYLRIYIYIYIYICMYISFSYFSQYSEYSRIPSVMGSSSQNQGSRDQLRRGVGAGTVQVYSLQFLQTAELAEQCLHLG